jgi:hypothetical protein
MGKVAAIINLEMTNPNSAGIDPTFVDLRYVYKNEKGWYGINKYATFVIKSKFAKIDYLVLVMKELYKKNVESSTFGKLFHIYFL